jgi:hypothetical protein
MTQRGDIDNQGLELDRYGDREEATLRREPSAEIAQLDSYDEDDVKTAPWIRRV